MAGTPEGLRMIPSARCTHSARSKSSYLVPGRLVASVTCLLLS